MKSWIVAGAPRRRAACPRTAACSSAVAEQRDLPRRAARSSPTGRRRRPSAARRPRRRCRRRPRPRQLGERAQDRRRGDHRRGDPDPLARARRSRSRSPARARRRGPGVNQARASTPSDARRASGSMRPLRSTSRRSHSSSKLRRRRAAIASDSTIASTFSCRRPRVDRPVRRAGPDRRASRTTYLWCIRSGIPGTGADVDRQLGAGSRARARRRVQLRRAPASRRCRAAAPATPRAAAARSAPATIDADRVGQADVVERELERRRGAAA